MRHRRALLAVVSVVVVLLVFHLAGYAPVAPVANLVEATPWLWFVLLGVVGVLAGRSLDRAWDRKLAARGKRRHP